jgi:uncharacterized protein (TIGR02246 family)
MVLPAPARAADAAASAAVDKAMHDFVTYWNAHDFKKMAAMFAPEGDLINPFNRVAKGRAEVEKLFTEEQTGPMKMSTYKMGASSMRQVGGVVIADWDGTVEGIMGEDGKMQPPFTHHVTTVYARKGGAWMIEATRAYIYASMPTK